MYIRIQVVTNLGHGAVVIGDGPRRRESPPWDIEDNRAGSSAIVPDRPVTPIDDREAGPPPLSQFKAPISNLGEPGEYVMGIPLTEVAGGKSTPSTLSDDAGEGENGKVGAANNRGQGVFTAKKRTNSRGGEIEEQDIMEESLDGRRKPRKSARLA